jgi:hypothetical protein
MPHDIPTALEDLIQFGPAITPPIRKQLLAMFNSYTDVVRMDLPPVRVGDTLKVTIKEGKPDVVCAQPFPAKDDTRMRTALLAGETAGVYTRLTPAVRRDLQRHGKLSFHPILLHEELTKDRLVHDLRKKNTTVEQRISARPVHLAPSYSPLLVHDRPSSTNWTS